MLDQGSRYEPGSGPLIYLVAGSAAIATQVDMKFGPVCRPQGLGPTLGGLKHHLRALACLSHYRGRPLDVIDDPNRL